MLAMRPLVLHDFEAAIASQPATTGPRCALLHWFCDVYCNAELSGNRTICFAFNEPKYNHSPYSRTVVIGE